ncbi:hypothetical protein L204_104510 [Cryptococcus depauperatus]|nr:hypothetical protein L204_03371 [Cryptococcus depauperatus CBS 7855]
MGDAIHSKIPVAINKNIPSFISDRPLNNRPASPSPLQSLPANGVGKFSPAVGVGGRRLSLIDGSVIGGITSERRSRNSSTRGSISMSEIGEDTAQLKAHVIHLKLTLESTRKRLSEVENTSSNQTSGGSPGIPYSSPIVPFKTVLIEEEDNDIGRYPPLDHDPSTSNRTESRSSSRGLPHSNGSYDLKARSLQTLKDGRTRIPQAVVAHHTALHPSSSFPPSPSASSINDNRSLKSPSCFEFSRPNTPGGTVTDNYGSLRSPSTPGTPGGRKASGKVIDSLQAEKLDLRAQLEKVFSESRASRRRIEQLTRQNEDLKETKERMRVENEGLNNVIARKERLLQETLQRARIAEHSLSSLQMTQKSLESNTKSQLSSMTSQLTEAEHTKLRAERECIALKESVKSLRDVWTREIKAVKSEVKRSEEREMQRREKVIQTHKNLAILVKSHSDEREKFQELVFESKKKSQDLTSLFETKIEGLRSELEKAEMENKQIRAQVAEIASELIRFRRLAQQPLREDLNEVAKHIEKPSPKTTPVAPSSPLQFQSTGIDGQTLEAELKRFPVPP